MVPRDSLARLRLSHPGCCSWARCTPRVRQASKWHFAVLELAGVPPAAHLHHACLASHSYINREPSRNVVNDELVIGRRLLASELEGEFDNFIDLTAEFSEPSSIRCIPSYRSFPILDGGAPTVEALRAEVASLRPGRTFVHCAQGHGRTGLFALAMLLRSGAARNIEDGLRMLAAARPAIRLNKEQQRCIQMYARNRG